MHGENMKLMLSAISHHTEAPSVLQHIQFMCFYCFQNGVLRLTHPLSLTQIPVQYLRPTSCY